MSCQRIFGICLSFATYLGLWWATGICWAFILILPLEYWNFYKGMDSVRQDRQTKGGFR